MSEKIQAASKKESYLKDRTKAQAAKATEQRIKQDTLFESNPEIKAARQAANYSLPEASLDMSANNINAQRSIFNHTHPERFELYKNQANRAERWNEAPAQPKTWPSPYSQPLHTEGGGIGNEYFSAGKAAGIAGKPVPNLNHLTPQQQASYMEGYGLAGSINLTNDIVDGIFLASGIGSGIAYAKKLGTLAIKRFGLFGARGGEGLLTPGQQLAKALQQSKVYEQLASIHSTSLNASTALKSKLSGLRNAQLTADITHEMPNGAIRYYEKFRQARNAGPSAGSRFVTEYKPKTVDVTMWNEVYDSQGLVNRIHLKNINGIEINSPHFPPTLKETLAQDFTNSYMPRRSY